MLVLLFISIACAQFIVQQRCDGPTLDANQTDIADFYRVSIASAPLSQRWHVAFLAVGNRTTALPFELFVDIDPTRYVASIVAASAGSKQLIITANVADLGLDFAVELRAPYAHGNIPCAGVAGTEIVSEFALISSEPPEPATGVLSCRHAQPAECVDGGPAAPSRPPNNSIIALVAWSAVTLVIIFAVIAAGTRQ